MGPGAGTPLAPTLEAACRRWSDRPAVTHQDQTLSYGELWDRVSALAAAYGGLGITAGDRVVCQLPNCIEHVVAINAAWACGAIHAGTDNDLTAPELAWLVGHTEAAALVFQARPGSSDTLEALHAVHQARPETSVLVKGTEVEGAWQQRLEPLLNDDGRARGDPRGVPATRLDDPALLLLTSGTTGKPKGVLESLRSCWAKMQFFADAFAPGPEDVHLLFLPMGHVFGLRLSLLPLLTGGRLVLADRFSPEAVLDTVGEHGVTVLPGMPAHLRLLIDAFDPYRHDVRSLRWAVSAAAPMPMPLAEQIYDRLGVEVLYVYGCSEGFTTLTTDRREIGRGSVGKVVFRGPDGTPPNGSVAILAPDEDVVLAPGEEGEIAFGASRPVQYWRAPDAAVNGWYRTGDLGHIDAEGCVYISGRLKELVNRGGLKVAPSEVEVAIASHPAVVDAAIVGTPDPVLGEAICACVVPATGESAADPPDLAELRAFLGASLARHKLPDELCLVAAIPRTKIGKVDRTALSAVVADPQRPRQRLRPR